MIEGKTIVIDPEPQPLALSAISGVNVEALLAKAIDAKSAVEVLERLMVMRREARAESAKEAFDRALAEFQRDCPTIAKKKQVFMNGKLRYSYAPLESIIQQVKELLQRHGFSYALDAIVKPGWVLAQCKATHAFGHSQTSSFEVPIDPDAYMNEAQKFASALTFAKRYAFCNAFGILTGDEDDDSGASSEKAQNAPRSAARSAPSAPPVQNASRGNSGAPVAAPVASQTPPKPFPTKESLTKALVALQAAPNMDGRNLVHEYFVKAGAILPTEALEDLPLRFCPNTPGLLRAVGAAIADFEAGNEALLAFPPHPEPESPAVQKPQKAQENGGAQPNGQQASEEPWRSFPTPFGKDAGIPLASLDKKKLFGWFANFKVETEYNGRPKKPETIAKDTKFREMLDQAGKHYGFDIPEDQYRSKDEVSKEAA